MRFFKLSLLFLFCSAANAADTVRLDTDLANFSVNATTSTTISLNVDVPTEQPTAEASAPKIYVPLEYNVGGVNSTDYFLQSESGAPAILDITSTNRTINYPLVLTVGSSNRYLYAAVYDSTDSQWEVVKMVSTPFLSVTNSAFSFPVSPAEICAQAANACQNLGVSSVSPGAKDFKMYFFLHSDNTLALGSVLTITSYPDGIYMTTSMSNKVIAPASYTSNITGVRRGDRRVFLTFTNTSVNNAKSIRVVRLPSSALPGDLPIGDATYAGRTLNAEVFPYSTSSELTVRDLTNGITYNFSYVVVDKYNFATPLSPPVEGSPAQIEELLKENKCFLLTAGFGENHEVIDYFRHFRDTILLQSAWGEALVDVYYEWGPKLALFIYDNEVLRSIIRGAAYILYFSFKHIYLMLLGVILFPALICLATLRKIKSPKV